MGAGSVREPGEGQEDGRARRFRQTPGTAGRIIDGKAAIVTRDNRLHILNPVGTRVWQLCERDASTADLVARLVAEFEVDEPTARLDCDRFLDDLVVRGILHLSLD